jgi:hypothetical protein
MKTFVVEGKVWRHQGESPWHFVYVNEKTSRQIKDTARARKNGLVRIKATIGDTTWTTALFPTKDGPYLIAIKADVRVREVIDNGDKVKISCTLI